MARARLELFAWARALGPMRLALWAELTVLCVQVGRRVAFPWDIVIWSESPFLTDMLRLHHGLSVYAPAADASSFVYAPGLAWLTFAALRPLGLHLDIVACRIVTVAIGLAAAALLTRAMTLLEPEAPPRLRFVFFALAVLTLFKSFTADVPHPDNLHIFQLAATLWLGLLAAERADGRIAAVAAGVAGVGVLAKQTAALTVIGLLAGLLLSRRFRARALWPAAIVGAASAAAATAALLVPTWSRYWTFSLLTHHPIDWKWTQLLFEVWLAPHRVFLWVAAGWALLGPWRERGDRSLLAVVAGCAIFGALPTWGAYFKLFGGSNNMTVIDVCALLVAAPLWADVCRRTSRASSLVAALLCATLVPLRMGPTPSIWRHARELDEAVARDVRAGKRVLVAHGAAYLIHAGDLSVPLDRANTMLELQAAGHGDRAGIVARIRATHYDRLYMNAIWYDAAVLDAVAASYQIERRIAAAEEVPPFQFGWQNLAPSTTVASPRPALPPWMRPAREVR